MLDHPFEQSWFIPFNQLYYSHITVDSATTIKRLSCIMNNHNTIDDNLWKRKSRFANWRQYLAQDVDKSWADVILLVACFMSGLVDSAVFNVWSCFVSMQTGEFREPNPPLLARPPLTKCLNRKHCVRRPGDVRTASQPALSMGQVEHRDPELLHRHLLLQPRSAVFRASAP